MTNSNQNSSSNPRLPLWRRMVPALGLFLLAPLTAEYLIGYLDSTGNFLELLGGLLIFSPLYGGAALIIREVTRRSGRGWLTIILLSTAFGLIQAGLVDHSLFNTSFMEIEWWGETSYPTYIPLLGISANHALNFIPGHVIWSIGVPIVIVEALAPQQRSTPWLGKFGLAITVVLYLLASALVFSEMAQTENFLPSMAQFIGTAVVVLILIVVAFVVRRPRLPVDAPLPKPWMVGVVTFVILNVLSVVEVAIASLGFTTQFVVDWRGTTLYFVLLTLLAILVWRWSQRRGWGNAHIVAVAGGALLTRAWLAFLVEPVIGDVALYDKLLHNTVFAIGSVVLLIMAAYALRSTKVEM